MHSRAQNTPALQAIYIYLYSTLHSLLVTIKYMYFTNCSYIYFVLNSAQSSGKKIIGNVTAKNYLKGSLLSIWASLFIRKRLFRKGFDPEILFCFLFSRTQWNRKGFLPNKKINYVACFNKFFAGKGFCEISSLSFIMDSSCCAICELNKFAYVGWNVICEIFYKDDRKFFFMTNDQ